MASTLRDKQGGSTWLSQVPTVPSGWSPAIVPSGGGFIFSALVTFACCERRSFPSPFPPFCLLGVLFVLQAVIFSPAHVEARCPVSSRLAKQCPVLISFSVNDISRNPNLGFYLLVQMSRKTSRKTHCPRNLGMSVGPGRPVVQGSE